MTHSLDHEVTVLVQYGSLPYQLPVTMLAQFTVLSLYLMRYDVMLLLLCAYIYIYMLCLILWLTLASQSSQSPFLPCTMLYSHAELLDFH